MLVVRRIATLTALACLLLVSSAVAKPSDLGTMGEYYASFQNQKPINGSALEAQGRYYASYGSPQSLTRPEPTGGSSDTPWLPIVLSAVAVLALAGTTQAHRVQVRRRAARVAV